MLVSAVIRFNCALLLVASSASKSESAYFLYEEEEENVSRRRSNEMRLEFRGYSTIAMVTLGLGLLRGLFPLYICMVQVLVTEQVLLQVVSEFW